MLNKRKHATPREGVGEHDEKGMSEEGADKTGSICGVFMFGERRNVFAASE